MQKLKLALLRAVGAGLAVAGVLALFRVWPLLGHLDLQFTPAARTKKQAKILVVTVRRETFSALGTDSFGGTLPRRFHAQLLQGLRRAGARGVVFDLLFTDPSPDDDAFREAIQADSSLPISLLVEPLSEGMRSRDEVVFRAVRPTVLPLLRPEHVILGHPLAWEPDGILRGARLVIEDSDTPGVVYPHLGLAALAGVQATDLEDSLAIEGRKVQVGDRSWMTGPGYEKLLRWAPPFPELEYAEALTLLEENRWEAFKDAIVIVGATNQGQRLDDMHPTAVGDMSGVQFIAQTANSLSLEDGRQPRFASESVLAVIGFLLALMALWVSSAPSWWRSLAAIISPPILVYASSAASMEAFSLHLGTLQASLPALLTAGVTLGVNAVRHFPLWAKLGWEGQSEDVCAVFFDVRGSTTVMAEAKDAEGLMVKLQSLIAKAVDSNGGYIERTMGDGAFAVFRSGDSQARAASALRAILDTEAACRTRSEDFKAVHGVSPQVVAGAEMAFIKGAVLRSQNRFEFSSFGRDIALAQRIEANARAFQSLCAIGPRMRSLVGEPQGFELKSHWLPLKGFDEEVEVFEIALEPQNSETPEAQRAE